MARMSALRRSRPCFLVLSFALAGMALYLFLSLIGVASEVAELQHGAPPLAAVDLSTDVETEFTEEEPALGAEPRARRIFPDECGGPNDPQPRVLMFRGRRVELTPEHCELNVSAAYAREKVKEMMRVAWDGYVRNAWGADELDPVGSRGMTTFGGCTGITILDAADTLYLLGLTRRFNAAREWIRSTNFSCLTRDVSVFETTIRSLGGMVSLYDLTGDEVFLQKAEELGRLLRPALSDMPNGLPARSCVLGRRRCTFGGDSNLAEAGTLQLEWRALAAASSDEQLKHTARVAEGVMHELMRASERKQTFAPHMVISTSHSSGGGNNNAALRGSAQTVELLGDLRIGAFADSYFEYLLKMHLQGGSADSEVFYRREYERQVEKIFRGVLSRRWPLRLREPGSNNAMEHLSCFFPGTIALSLMSRGSSLSVVDRRRWSSIAEGLTESCYLMYLISPLGLAPDVVKLDPEAVVPFSSAYLQRPEAIEAMFYLWRFTKKEKYRSWAWNIFQAIETNSRVRSGYASINDVFRSRPVFLNYQQSYFLAETIKYLYLIFCDDDVLPLDQWVFNTEAHPLKVRPEVALESVKMM